MSQQSENDDSPSLSRRKALNTITSSLALLLSSPAPSRGAIIEDVTDTYANTSPDSSYANITSQFPPVSSQIQAETTPSDEFTILFPDYALKEGLGIELTDKTFRTNRRVVVQSVRPFSLADSKGVEKNWIVVSINNEPAERTDSRGVQNMVQRAITSGKDLEIRFRDPVLFQENIRNLKEGETVTTQVAPAGDTTQRNPDGSVKPFRSLTEQMEQKLSVTQLRAPLRCSQGAKTDDLLEISYIGTVVETGAVFDGSMLKIGGDGIPGRGGDVTIYFVLGKQPFGQFPPGWDVGLQDMCVGERRRIIVPPVLGYGSKGVPNRGIPPNATLQYDVSLISINGLATPK